jgi:hypothetical protein
VQFNGTKPIYKEVGSYCYRENRTRLNVTWSDDRTLVAHMPRKVRIVRFGYSLE